MSSAPAGLLSLWRYEEAGQAGLRAALPAMGVSQQRERQEAVSPGVPESEVARRVAEAFDRGVAKSRVETAEQHQRELEQERARLTAALDGFAQQRESYFQRVEAEVVRLALTVARKILQREAQVDPELLGALVRIALERMQRGSASVRVAPAEAERWRAMALRGGAKPRWQVVEDESLSDADCMVETDLGTANFSFTAQMGSIEEAVTGLLAHRAGL